MSSYCIFYVFHLIMYMHLGFAALPIYPPIELSPRHRHESSSSGLSNVTSSSLPSIASSVESYYMHRRRLPTPTSPTFNWSPSMSPRLPRAVPSVSASSVYPAFTTPLSDHQRALDLGHSSSYFRPGSPNITTAARLVSPSAISSARPSTTTVTSSDHPCSTTVTSSARLSISSTPLRVHSSRQFVSHSPPVSSPSSSSSSPTSSPVSSGTSNVSPPSPLAGGPSSHPRRRVLHNRPRRMYRIPPSYPILNTAPVISPASIPPTFAEVCRVIAIFFLILAHHGSPH